MTRCDQYQSTTQNSGHDIAYQPGSAAFTVHQSGVTPRMGALKLRSSILAGVFVLALPVAGSGGDIAPLSEVKSIDDGLFAIGLADQIRKNCPVISARVFKALGALQDLNNQAMAMGYTKEEIDAHVESDIEKDRLRARAKDYMAEQGLVPDETGYCALGKSEIGRNSKIGSLLREAN